MTMENASREQENPQWAMRRDRNIGTIDRVLSTVTGGMLLLYGLRRRTPGGIGLAFLGGGLVQSGVTGRSAVYDALHINTACARTTDEREGDRNKIVESRTITIDKSPDELYQFWRNPENLPKVMDFVESVMVKDDTHAQWVVKTPIGTTVAFDVEMNYDDANRKASWHASGINNASLDGTASFNPVPNGAGTEARLNIEIRPPVPFASTIAKLSGIPKRRLDSALQNLKELMETGREMPATQ